MEKIYIASELGTIYYMHNDMLFFVPLITDETVDIEKECGVVDEELMRGEVATRFNGLKNVPMEIVYDYIKEQLQSCEK